LASVNYVLGAAVDLEQLFPEPKYANPNLGFRDYCDVIAHYTHNSTMTDGLLTTSVDVRHVDGNYVVHLDGNDDQATLDQFAARHVEIFSSRAAMKAVRGKQLMEGLGVWNPMEGFPVNHNPNDGKCKWHLFPPLGLSIVNQQAILLMHYPPWAVLEQATFGNAMTWARWNDVLIASGMPADQTMRCQTIVDVNPIAAPGSGQSEYPNDYFPIMMASAFFDGGPDRDYIRSMLDLYLNPPHNEDNDFTLPLLVCGSPLYDPQAPGWFRTAYKDILPVNANGTPTTNVLQAGRFRVKSDSAKETPYMVANHMIAAGVTGACTNDPTQIPDIRLYEAQDLTAATFLKLLADNPKLTAEEAKAQAATRWFGNPEGTPTPGVGPNPADPNDKLVICALAQMDLYFVATPGPHDLYTFDQAMQRCRDAKEPGNPCCQGMAPSPEA
jgi:hypothetical protein